MEIGTYSDGRSVVYDEATNQFRIEGIPTTAELLVRYDGARQVAWTSEALRTWVHEYASNAAESQASAQVMAAATVAPAGPALAYAGAAGGGYAGTSAGGYAGAAGGGYAPATYSERYGLVDTGARVSPSSTNVVGRRYTAFLIDSIIVWTAIVIAMVFVGIVVGIATQANRDAMDSLRALFQVIAYGMLFGYFVVSEARWGTTLGKRMLGLHVLTAGGDRISFTQALVRNILLPVDLIFFSLVGLLSMKSSDIHQRVGDRAAGTAVVQQG